MGSYEPSFLLSTEAETRGTALSIDSTVPPFFARSAPRIALRQVYPTHR